MQHIIEVLDAVDGRVSYVVLQAEINKLTVTLERSESTRLLVSCQRLKHGQHCDEETLVDLDCKLLHQQLTVSGHDTAHITLTLAVNTKSTNNGPYMSPYITINVTVQFNQSTLKGGRYYFGNVLG